MCQSFEQRDVMLRCRRLGFSSALRHLTAGSGGVPGHLLQQHARALASGAAEGTEGRKPGIFSIARDVLRSKDEKHGDSPAAKRASNMNSLKRILGLLRPEGKPLGIAISTLGVTTTISLVFPAAVGQILDIAMAPTGNLTPVTIAAGMMGLFTVQTAFMGIRTTILSNMGERVANRLRK